MKLFAYSFFLFLIVACNNKPQTTDAQEAEEGLPADFEKFYLAFHEDTVFQLEHISFPLSGSPSMLDTIIVTDIPYFWEKDSWDFHTSYDPSSNFDRTFEVHSKDMISEQFSHTEMPLIMERRFAKTSDGWKLIYYAAPAPGKRL